MIVIRISYGDVAWLAVAFVLGAIAGSLARGWLKNGKVAVSQEEGEPDGRSPGEAPVGE